jgi:hypothetical protein
MYGMADYAHCRPACRKSGFPHKEKNVVPLGFLGDVALDDLLRGEHLV